MRNLIVYFSRKGNNYWKGSIKYLAKGNTEIVAEFIQKAVGGDLFEVEPLKLYSEDYYQCTDEAKQELSENQRPEIKKYVSDINAYDNIFIGYPNWWGTMPMVMFTFLEHYDLKGKKIIPFCTNEGSGMGSSEHDLAKICIGAKIVEGLAIKGTMVATSEKKVIEWAQKSVL